MGRVTYEQLKAQWDAICDKEEDDPIEEWNKYKKQVGVVDQYYFEYNWGEYGILPVFRKLIEMINEGRRVYLVDDPSCEGMMGSSYLVFNAEDERNV